MEKHALDPDYKSAMREALLALIVFVVPLLFTVTYCASTGYDRDPRTVASYWGIPDWVWWGVFVPWTLCVGFTAWFTFFHMAHDDPDEGLASDNMEEHSAGMKAEERSRGH